MKSIPLVFLTLVASLSPVISQVEKIDVPFESASPTTERILGTIPDGTPTPPEVPKPKFIVPAKDILHTKTIAQGGRIITVRQITPIALPPAQEAAPQIDLTDPVVQHRIAAFRGKQPHLVFLVVGATVYHFDDSPPRSLVQIWPQAEGEPVTVWSSADFSLLSGLSTFAGSSGETNQLMMMWSVTNLPNKNALQKNFARQFQAPQIPDLPPGAATFVIAPGKPTATTLASIRSLHDLYHNEYGKLKAAYDGREQARLAQEAQLKAHPPKPKDITLNYWRIDSPATSVKGGNR